MPTPLLIGLLIGIPFGSYVSLVSHRHQAVTGGFPAHLFHVLGAIVACSAPPTALISVFSGVGILNTLIIAFGLIGTSLLLLTLYAVFEKPALERAVQSDERGWTADKARSSGL